MDSDTQALLFRPPASMAGNWRAPFFRAADAALDLIYPPHCCSCSLPLPAFSNKALCEKCAERIRWIGSDCCQRCGDAVGMGLGVVTSCPSCRTFPPRFVEASAAAARYEEGPVRDLVLSVKFGRKVHVAHTIGNILAQRITTRALITPDTIVVPAPLARGRARERGFNQAEELARRIARRLSLMLETRLLRKIRATPAQATLPKEKRRENLVDAFACNPKVAQRYAGRRVLLIDDVITTGATVSECARTLHAAGLGPVRAAAFARG
jgi:ComF family protein